MKWFLAALMLAQDAGVSVAPPAAPPQQVLVVPDAQTVAELQSLRADLRATNARLDSTIADVKALRAEVAAAAERPQSKQAAVTLGAIDQQLSTGNTAITSGLDEVEPSLGPSARANLQAARTALANSDVATARVYLWQASVDAQAGR